MILSPARFALAVGLLLMASLSSAQSATLLERVEAIERSNVRAPWQESAALIDALLAEHADLPSELVLRIDLVRARNLALDGRYRDALELTRTILEHAEDPRLRVKTLVLAINSATNVTDFATAFTYLKEALKLRDDSDVQQVRVLGTASYLYLRVGEETKALEFAQSALDTARRLHDDRETCMALSDFSVALEEIGHFAQAEGSRREQLDACVAAADPVFTADAYKGIGRSLLEQGQADKALPWLSQARERFMAAGFATGALETDMTYAKALVQSGGSLQEAARRLRGALPTFEKQESWDSIELSQRLLSDIAESEGSPAVALDHMRKADAARQRLDQEDRERRLAYLQTEFETAAKTRQISSLESERERANAEIESRARSQWRQSLALVVTAILLAALLAMLWRSLVQRRRYRRASETDGLTGLYNHQSTLRHGQALLLRSRRTHKAFTAVVADIDHFKQINDRHGHAAGDAVLKSLGDLLRSTFASPIVIGRSGGEEFTILLDMDTASTRRLIETLRARMRPTTVLDHTVEYSLSFGISAPADDQASLESLLRDADMALYQAKRNGRNQIVDATDQPQAKSTSPGLIVVGSGIQLGRHLSPRCLSEIEEAECVFALTDGAAHAMLTQLRPDLIDLRRYYADGKDRRQTYREMEAAIMAEVQAGKRVCAVFYGHPGVFADVPHAIMRKARAAGITARMEPGISSEACLYADLGIDPGQDGVQSLESTQFLIEDRRLDTRSLLVLWQIALVGDTRCTRFHAEPTELAKLVERLLRDYPADHEVILYEAARLPIENFRAERLPLRDLASAHYEEFTTLVVPPLPSPRATAPPAAELSSESVALP